MAPVVIRGTPSHPRPCTGSAPLCSHFRSYALPGSHTLPSLTAQAVSVPPQWEGAWLSLPSPPPPPAPLTRPPYLSASPQCRCQTRCSRLSLDQKNKEGRKGTREFQRNRPPTSRPTTSTCQSNSARLNVLPNQPNSGEGGSSIRLQQEAEALYCSRARKAAARVR